MRAFDAQQLRNMETGASGEVEDLCAEVRRLYAEQDTRANTEGAVYTLLMSAHQQLHGAARTLEGALKMLAPPETQAAAPPPSQQEPPKKRPRVLMDEQPV